MPGAVIARGDRELSLRFETFPERAAARLEVRIAELIARLEARAEQVVPVGKGLLRSEIRGRTYKGEQGRIAGYVSVYAPSNPKREYAKAATLEYGSNKARRLNARATRGNRAVQARLSQPVSIRAYRFLRGPFEEMSQEIRDELEAALNEVIEDDNP